MKTNTKTAGWFRRYTTALHTHLKKGPGTSMRPAHMLGRQAAALGVKTLNLALMREQALMNFLSNRGSSSAMSKMIVQARNFFTATIIPIEATHHAVQDADMFVHQLNQTLQKAIKISKDSFKKEIGSIQRLVQESTRKVDRFAYEFGI